jgi:hypothetical protein
MKPELTVKYQQMLVGTLHLESNMSAILGAYLCLGVVLTNYRYQEVNVMTDEVTEIATEETIAGDHAPLAIGAQDRLVAMGR